MQLELLPLFSGSTGNAILVSAGGSRVLVDAGVSARSLKESLLCANVSPREISAILVTHEHTDHIKGAPVFAREFGIPVYASEGTWRAMHSKFKSVEEITLPGGDFFIKDVGVRPFALSHDAAEPVGYSFYYRAEKVSVATDTGCVSKKLFSEIDGSNAVALEFNHDVQMLKTGPYPYILKKRVLSSRGHLSNDDAAAVLARLADSGCELAYLSHISIQNNIPSLAESTAREALASSGHADVQVVAAAPAMFQKKDSSKVTCNAGRTV